MKKSALVTTSSIAGILSAAALGAWFYYLISASVGEITTIKKDIADIEKREANIKMLEELMRSISEKEEKLSKYFADSPTLVDFIERLEMASREAGALLVIESAQFSDSNGASLPRFNLKTTGSFAANYRYLQLIEAMPFQIEINDAAFSIGEGFESGQFWQLRLAITLLSFIGQ